VHDAIYVAKDRLLDGPLPGFTIATDVEGCEAVDIGHMENWTEALVKLLGGKKSPKSTAQGLAQPRTHFYIRGIRRIHRFLGRFYIHVRSV